MMDACYLLMSFGDNAWGRAASARALGEDLRRLGRAVKVVSGRAGVGSFEGSGLAVELLPDLPGSLLKIYFEEMIDRLGPAGIVFCDGDSILHALHRLKLDPDLFTRKGTPVFGIDTWSRLEVGLEADVFGDGKQSMQVWPDWLTPIRTAPLSRIGTGEDVCSGLFHLTVPKGDIGSDPGFLSASPARRFAMISTAPWQHEDLRDERAARVQREVPALLASAIGAVPELDLVHVGPEPLQGFQALGPRYHWMGALPPARYARLMAKSTVYLSLSPVCSAQAKALGLGIPVLLFQHLETSGRSKGLPYPFRIWPIGYSSFLEPVLRGNPLSAAVTTAELSRPESMIQALHDLTFDGEQRDRVLAQQAGYVQAVRSLPRVASYLIERFEKIPISNGRSI